MFFCLDEEVRGSGREGVFSVNLAWMERRKEKRMPPFPPTRRFLSDPTRDLTLRYARVTSAAVASNRTPTCSYGLSLNALRTRSTSASRSVALTSAKKAASRASSSRAGSLGGRAGAVDGPGSAAAAAAAAPPFVASAAGADAPLSLPPGMLSCGGTPTLTHARVRGRGGGRSAAAWVG